MSENTGSKGFYEAKGLERHMVILPPEYRERLKGLSKQFKITQGEVIEVMLDQLDLDAMAQHFQAKKADKNDGRVVKTELAKKMREASADKLAEIERILSQ